VIRFDAPLKLLEPLPTHLLAGSAASVVFPMHKELTVRGFDVRLEIGGRTYELWTTDARGGDGFRSRGLAFARRVVLLAPGMLLEQQIVLPNTGDTVGISWRLLGKKITPVRLTATPIFSSAEPISSEIFVFDAKHDSGRLTWLPFRRAGKIIADTNGHCTEPAVVTDSHEHKNTAAPSAFVFDLGRRPALLLLSVELRTSGATDRLIGQFLAKIANPRREDPDFLAAASRRVMALQQAKGNSSRARRPRSRSASDYQIDEARPADYRRYDRSAETEKVLRHCLPGLARIPDPNAAPESSRESVRDKIISGRDRSESSFGQKTSSQTTPTHAKHLLRPTSKPGKDKHEASSGLKISMLC
jgi:hypothetical protein